MAPLSSSALTEDKRALRREMGARRAGLLRRRTARAQRSCLGTAARAAGAGGRRQGPLPWTLAGYVAAKGEIDPRRRWRRPPRAGGRVALPRVATEDAAAPLPPRRTPRRSTPGRFGLLEPAASAPEVPLDELDVVIVPGAGVRRRRAAARVRRRLLRRRVRRRVRAGRRAPGADRARVRFPDRRALSGRRRRRAGRPGGDRGARAAARREARDDRASGRHLAR